MLGRGLGLSVIGLLSVVLLWLGGSACPTEIPADVSATDGTYCDKVVVTWSTVAGATLYEVQRATEGLGLLAPIGTTSSTTYSDTGVLPGVTYYYAVAAYGDEQSQCGWSYPSDSDPGHVLGELPEPVNVNASDGLSCSKIVIQWNAVPGAISYEVGRSWDSVGPFFAIGTSPSTMYVDRSVHTGESYYYAVKAHNSCRHSSYSSSDGGSIKPLPATPSGVRASNGTYCDRVAVEWDAVGGATSYEVQRSLSSADDYEIIATTAGTSLEDLTALPDTDHYYRVRAESSCGWGEPSEEVIGSLGSSLPSPMNIVASDGSHCSGVTVTWLEIPGATSYEVHRAPSEAGDYVIIGTTTEAVFEDGTATPGAVFYYKVAAVNACGTSPLSDHDVGASLVSPCCESSVAQVSVEGFVDRIELRWPSSPGAETYFVYRGDAAASDWTLLGETAGQTCWVDWAESSGLVPCESYDYRVLASSGYPPDEFIASAVLVRPSSFSTPTKLRASEGLYIDRIEIEWDAIEWAEGYRVYRTHSESYGVAESEMVAEVLADTHWADYLIDLPEHISPYRAWYYIIQGFRGCWESVPSEVASGFMTPPTVNLSVSASDGSDDAAVNVSWGSLFGALSYSVHRLEGEEWVLLADSLDRTHYADRDVRPCTTCQYKVVADISRAAYPDKEEEDWPSFLSDYATGIDAGWRLDERAIPTDFQVTRGMFQDRVELSWDRVPGVDAYMITRSTASPSGPYEFMAEVSEPGWTDRTGEPGMEYYYRLFSGSNQDCVTYESIAAGPECGFKARPMLAPLGVVASDGQADQIHVSWYAAKGAEAYAIYRVGPEEPAHAVATVTERTSWTDMDVLPYLVYEYRVCGIAQGRNGLMSSPDTGYSGSLSAPTGVSAAAGPAEGTIEVSWNAVENAEAYSIYRASSGGTCELVETLAGATVWTDAAVSCGTHSYRVAAIRGPVSSEQSLPTAALHVAGLPAPNSVTASRGLYTDRIAVSWDPVLGADMYRIFRAGTGDPIETLMDTSSSCHWNDTGVVPGVVYEYYVIAQAGSCRSMRSDSDFGSAGLELKATLEVEVTECADKIVLHWAPVIGAERYVIYRGPQAVAQWTELGQTTDQTFWIDSASFPNGPVPGESYDYRIAQLPSLFGPNEVMLPGVSLLCPPAEPTNVAASDGAYFDRVAVTWDRIEGAQIYNVYRSSAPPDDTWELAEGALEDPSWTDRNVIPFETYRYCVTAEANEAVSAPSPWDSGFASLGVPQNVSASDGQWPDRVLVTWSAVEGAESYTVYRALPDQDLRAVGSVLGDTQWVDLEAVPFQAYEYSVAAERSGVLSSMSSQDLGSCGRSTPTPPAPERPSATDGDYADKVVLTWPGEPVVEEYRVYRSMLCQGPWELVGTVVETAFSDQLVQPGEFYYYHVTAVWADQESPPSPVDWGFVMPSSCGGG